ncbi:MAG: AsnC family transcriptional regulator [Candidatus Bathyarchaeia archaeon]|jgi:Lrp/AsnC family transcriptional regulator for asnA, asnC and gidA
MDNINSQIIEELTVDARVPFSSIAKKIGVSTQTVINRYNEMRSKGVISRSSISVNLAKVGYIGTVHMFLEVLPSRNPTATIEKLKKMENLIVASTTMGDYEGYVVSVFRNVKDLYEQILKIKQLPDIANLEFFIAIPGFEHFPAPNMLQNNPDSVK